MFNKNFFPTPEAVIEKMLEPYFRKISHSNGLNITCRIPNTILEPSAGKGDIIKYIEKKQRNTNIYAIELNPDLSSILKDQYCKVIHDDFLSFHTHIDFGLIVMNPPFDHGAAHLLKAWEIAKNTDIVCLLNAETIHNPYTKERQLLAQIIADNNGTVEDFGQCFRDAERKSNVEVVCVRITKSTPDTFKFDPADFDMASHEFPDDLTNNAPAINDVLQAYEDSYIAATEAMKASYKAHNKAAYFIGNILKCKMRTARDYQDWIQDFTAKSWEVILQKSNFTKYMTQKVRDRFMNDFTIQKEVAFTKQNMIKLFEVLHFNQGKILDECIIEVFDHFTKYHKDNRKGIEGWKTNDAYLVNRKVIYPYTPIRATYGARFEIEWNARYKMNDIDRAIDTVIGRKFDDEDPLNLANSLQNTCKQCVNITGALSGNTGESRHFRFKFYKKGTLHLEFKDVKTWELFNRTVAKIKGYPLPGETAKTKAKRASEEAQRAAERKRKADEAAEYLRQKAKQSKAAKDILEELGLPLFD